ncbi:protein FAM170A-like [Cavia porcellus]|uniref:protein FAM170A-like n=1 Tax=Cavia porcellus TaxID=10141 RepID=UPI002FE0635F
MAYITLEHLSSEDKSLDAESDEFSQYFPRFPSRKRPLRQDLVECQNCSFTSGPRSSSTFINNPSMTSGCAEGKRVMNVYYMRVLTRRGVAIFEDAEGDLQPPPKRISIAKLSFPEGIPPKVILPEDTGPLLGDSKAHGDSDLLEEWKDGDRAWKPLAQQICPRAKTPPWLLDLERGFRCMGCCRVFPTLKALTRHVAHGLEEGFSCLAFHRAFARLRSKRKKERKRVFRKPGLRYRMALGRKLCGCAVFAF